MTNEQKLTDWYPTEVLPARAGWYLREYSAHSNRSARLNEIPDYFDGKHWYYGDGGGGRASIPVPNPTVMRWRGLAEPPLTNWFDPDTPPVRQGVYETDESDKDGQCFAYWDGEKFGFRCWSHLVKGGAKAAIKRAHENADLETGFPNLTRWRGLAIQP